MVSVVRAISASRSKGSSCSMRVSMDVVMALPVG
jgi:hypothetical protein